jgi:methyl-accepting chemotaxis protein
VPAIGTRYAASVRAGDRIRPQVPSATSRFLPAECLAEVTEVAEASAATGEQVSAATQQSSASTQQIAASAQQPAGTARELERLVARFELA